MQNDVHAWTFLTLIANFKNASVQKKKDSLALQEGRSRRATSQFFFPGDACPKKFAIRPGRAINDRLTQFSDTAGRKVCVLPIKHSVELQTCGCC